MTPRRKLQAKPDDRGLRLDIFLSRNLDDLTRSQIQALNRSGAVHIDGQVEKAGYKIRGNEVIEVDLKPLERRPLEPEHIPLQIVHEDPDLAIIEKPAGLVVHPGAGTGNYTVVHGLLYLFRDLSGLGGAGRPGIVHRLDKWTSGLLIVARNDWTHARLTKAFQDRSIEKTYVALVHGKLHRSSGEIALNIARHSSIRTRMSAQTSRGRSALSTYEVVRELPGFSLLEVKIKTGRTHQIRVHLSAIGHPVVGDDIYGERRYAEFTRKYGKLGRYFLHASSLRFHHPRTGELLEFRSALPGELSNLLERIQK